MFHMLLVKLESIMMLKSVNLEGTGYADTFPLSNHWGLFPGTSDMPKPMSAQVPCIK